MVYNAYGCFTNMLDNKISVLKNNHTLSNNILKQKKMFWKE